jgi:pimeloyl-ACP methyl ester carboxylesterase
MFESPVTAVLIHGAWAGGWVWDTITPFLQKQGFRVLAPDLPGCSARLGNPAKASMNRCVSDLMEQLADIDDSLLIVGHSGGGAVASQLAETVCERVVGVAYLAGMMLPSDTGFGEVVAEIIAKHPEASGIGPYLEWEADGQVSRVPRPAIRKIFLQDVSAALAEQAIPRFGRQAEGGRALVPHWTPERFGQLPRLYVETRQDRSVVLPVQRLMQALVPGAKVVSIDTGHVPQLAAPQAVADALATFVTDHLPAIRPAG